MRMAYLRKVSLETAKPEDILNFWFAPENKPKWYIKDPEFDKAITEKFLGYYEEATKGNLDHWQKSLAGSLALIILFDQFPRNMFRNHAKSYSTDAQALAITKSTIIKGMDKEASMEYRHFLYMPLMHSENLSDQTLSVRLFANMPSADKHARAHMEIIRKFGRFPHRNAILGRKSTAEEIKFLDTPSSSF